MLKNHFSLSIIRYDNAWRQCCVQPFISNQNICRRLWQMCGYVHSHTAYLLGGNTPHNSTALAIHKSNAQTFNIEIFVGQEHFIKSILASGGWFVRSWSLIVRCAWMGYIRGNVVAIRCWYLSNHTPSINYLRQGCGRRCSAKILRCNFKLAISFLFRAPYCVRPSTVDFDYQFILFAEANMNSFNNKCSLLLFSMFAMHVGMHAAAEHYW